MHVFTASSQSLVHRQHRIADTSPHLLHDNVQRFMLAGAAHGPSAKDPQLGSAPGSIKRVELNRSLRRLGYGH
jgi:hypothetical protein